MTDFKIFKPENRMAGIFRHVIGVTPAEAISRAEIAVSEMRPLLLSGVQGKLSAIHEAIGRAAAAPPEVDRIYRLTNEVFAEAGALDLERLSWAARFFCDLLMRFKNEGVWDQEAAEVCVATMRLLLTDTASGDDLQWQAIRDGLKRISDPSGAAAAGQGRPQSEQPTSSNNFQA